MDHKPPWTGVGLGRELPVPAVRRNHVPGKGEGLPWEGEETEMRRVPASLCEPNAAAPETSPREPMGPAKCGTSSEPPCSPLPPSPEPQITSPPYDTWNITGQDVIFGCEVFAYPMASIEWRKDGTEMLLPGDDPHISVQVSRVPRALKMTPG